MQPLKRHVGRPDWAKFPVVENNFPVLLSPEIPCLIIQGIASKVPNASADLSVANAANGPVL
jgi:hypothetical protein